MAKMKANTVDFDDSIGKLATADAVELTWASVNEPDSTHIQYSVEMKWPKDAAWVKELIQTATDYENERRKHYGIDEVPIASIFLTKNGDPRVSDCGEFYLPRASGKSNDAEYVLDSGRVVPKFGKNKPRVFDISATQDDSIVIWTGDKCRVAFTLGFFNSSGSFGTKFYLKDVQQIEAGPGPSNSNPFGDESGNTPSSDAIPF